MADCDEEWEICDDNGFVFKRRRRRRLTDFLPPAPSFPPSDAEAVLRRHRRARKKRCLLALRDKYQAELSQWENLSSSFSSSLFTSPPEPTASVLATPAQPQPPSPSPTPNLLIEELLSLAEAQEAMLRKLGETCEHVESVCEERERRLAQVLLDLPIWGSPRSLITSLTD